MGSFVRKAGGIGAAVLAGAALTAVPSAAQAAKGGVRHVKVPCSETALAQQISTANGLAVPTVLWLSPHCTYSYLNDDLGAAGDALPPISKDITLVGGPSTAIRRSTNATENFRILDVLNGGTLRVAGISILGGDPASAAVEEGGGIRNAGTLMLKFVTLSGNTAGSTGGGNVGGNGGGLSNLGNAVAFVTNTLISGNRAVENGNATGAGGGVVNRGTLTLTNSRLTLNTADDGGGALDTITPGTTQVIRSTIDRNLVPAATGTGGGGIFNSGTTSLNRSLVTLNNATGTAQGGGGIDNFTGGTVTLTQSLVTNNNPNNCVPLNTISGCVN